MSEAGEDCDAGGISGCLEEIAPDLRQSYPRSLRETLAGYVLAARILDKCRATLLKRNGEYNYACSLDQLFFDFTGIDPAAFSAFVATGADDEAVARWIAARSCQKERLAVIKWNNRLRDMRLSEAPDFAQEYMEDYIAQHLPRHRPVYHYFDIYDLEEGRL